MVRTWVGPNSNGLDNKPEDNNETSRCCQAQVQTWLISPICGIQASHSLLHAFEIFLQPYPQNIHTSQKEPRKIFDGVPCWSQNIGLSLRHLILRALGSFSLLPFQVKGRRSTHFGKQCWLLAELNDHHTLSSQCCLAVGMRTFTHSVHTSVSQALPLCTEAQTMEADAIYLLETSHPYAIMPLWKHL